MAFSSSYKQEQEGKPLKQSLASRDLCYTTCTDVVSLSVSITTTIAVTIMVKVQVCFKAMLVLQNFCINMMNYPKL